MLSLISASCASAAETTFGPFIDVAPEGPQQAFDFENLFHTIGWLNLELIDAELFEKDHEKRAAWICLLTAACAATGKTEVVGDEAGGWFWLPPTNLWAQWARDALAHNTTELREQRYAS